MTIGIYAIKDKINDFLPPQPLPNDETAARWFREMLATNPTMNLNPNDFEVYKLADWNTTTGEFTNDFRVIAINAKEEREVATNA